MAIRIGPYQLELNLDVCLSFDCLALEVENPPTATVLDDMLEIGKQSKPDACITAARLHNIVHGIRQILSSIATSVASNYLPTTR
jgi:hypothetical protein